MSVKVGDLFMLINCPEKHKKVYIGNLYKCTGIRDSKFKLEDLNNRVPHGYYWDIITLKYSFTYWEVIPLSPALEILFGVNND